MPKADTKLTVADYMNLPDEFPRYELVEGDLLLTPSPIFRHQRVVSNIEAQLRAWVEEENHLGLVVIAPMDVILSNETVLQPDVMVILNENLRIIRDRIEGPPDLVVEVLSPSTSHRDDVPKRRLYAHHGVKELWIVDPDRRTIEVNERGPAGFLPARPFTHPDTIRSPLLPGLSFGSAAIFDR